MQFQINFQVNHTFNQSEVFLPDVCKFGYIKNKKLYRAFRRQANGLTLNTPVFQGLLRVNGKAEKMRKVDKSKIMN